MSQQSPQCQCYIAYQDDDADVIHYCPLHQAAPELLSVV